MIETWWNAHIFEFWIAGIAIGTFLVVSIIYGIVSFIFRRIREKN